MRRFEGYLADVALDLVVERQHAEEQVYRRASHDLASPDRRVRATSRSLAGDLDPLGQGREDSRGRARRPTNTLTSTSCVPRASSVQYAEGDGPADRVRDASRSQRVVDGEHAVAQTPLMLRDGSAADRPARRAAGRHAVSQLEHVEQDPARPLERVGVGERRDREVQSGRTCDSRQRCHRWLATTMLIGAQHRRPQPAAARQLGLAQARGAPNAVRSARPRRDRCCQT